MPPVSTKDLVRFTPDRLKEREDAPVFLLKVPTMRDNIAFTTALLEEGLVYPSDVEYVAVLRAAIAECVSDDEQADLLQIIDEYEAAEEAGREAVRTGQELEPAEDRVDLYRRVDEITTTLRPHYPPLARLIAARSNLTQMMPLVRVRMFLAGLEGEGAPPLGKKFGRLTDATLDRVEGHYGSGTVAAISNRILELTTPTVEEKKTLASPAPLPPAPETSTEESPLPMVPNGKLSGFDTPATLN